MKQNKLKGTIIVVFAALLILGICSTLYLVALTDDLEENIYKRLEEAAHQSTRLLQMEIRSKQEVLSEALYGLEDFGQSTPEQIVSGLGSIAEKYGFTRIGIIFQDGSTLTTDGADLYLGDRDFFLRSMQGEAVLSDTIYDRMSGEPINVYSVPVYMGYDRPQAVLFATYQVDKFAETISFPILEGEGYSYVIKSNGDVVANHILVDGIKPNVNLFEAIAAADSGNDDAVEILVARIAAGESGYIEYYMQTSKYAYFCPMEINDWYLLTIVPSEKLEGNMNNIVLGTYLLLLAFIVVLSMLLLFNMYMQRMRRDELVKLVFVDELTGGYTYTKFCMEAERILDTYNGNSAILSLDINDFKLINNMYGYDMGNILIKYLYDKIKANLNISYQEELVSHHSADKFVVLMHYSERDELEKRLKAICNDLTEYYLDSRRYHLRPVIGVFDVQGDKRDIRLMVDGAAIARKSIKGSSHENFFAYYDEGVRNQLVKGRNIENEMGDALKNKEFVVFYQPKYSTIDQSIVGAEALVRWRKPNGSFILPRDFIPIFESNGFITTLDKYMFGEVCAAQRRWLDRGFAPVPVSVNLSRLHLHNTNFVTDYQKMIYDNEIPPYYVQLEITESAMFENPEILKDTIERLHEVGISILMDDFGTGYSSLLMLKDIDIDVLKLDKSFVDDIGNERGEKIINAILRLTQSLNIEVTAEGVEKKSQFDFLKEYECDNVQGYYFAAPMPEEEFEKLLKKEGQYV